MLAKRGKSLGLWNQKNDGAIKVFDRGSKDYKAFVKNLKLDALEKLENYRIK